MEKKYKRLIKNNELRIAVIGLGYVGLPLAAEFAKSTNVLAFDIDKNRIKELNSFYDRTNEVSSKVLKTKRIKFTHSVSEISKSNFYIISGWKDHSSQQKPIRPGQAKNKLADFL